MAAPTFNWAWPKAIPASGGYALVRYTGSGVATAVTIGGTACDVYAVFGGSLIRVKFPSMSGGAKDLVLTDSGGSFTAAGAFTVGPISRLYICNLSSGTNLVTPSGSAFQAPAANHCAAAIASGHTFPISGAEQRFLSPSKAENAAPYGYDAASVIGPVTFPGLGAVGGFVLPLVGVRALPAQNWTFGAGGYYWGDPGNNWDKVALYVYRPSTSSVVGVIFDNTGTTDHPAGTLSQPGKEAIKFTIAGAGVSAIQDDDVLCCEWLGVGSAGQPLWSYVYYSGDNVPGANHSSVPGPVAAYIEAENDIFAITTLASGVVQPTVMCCG